MARIPDAQCARALYLNNLHKWHYDCNPKYRTRTIAVQKRDNMMTTEEKKEKQEEKKNDNIW